ncbi:MAG: acylneuraminate cytidylyltransferase family protein [Dehalococcoidia bacterium]|nr:MAG: acylneuraminate cytidylyltransferase family protein [Dehalococcoidia bacterium]
MTRKLTAIALIPARAGSKRVRHKNIRPLGGHPLLAYAIAAVLESDVFSRVVVSTDSRRYAAIARYYGADVPFLRPKQFAGELSPDIEWVKYTLVRLADEGENYDCFAILRPTSPFRQPATIRRARREFISQNRVDSLRAVEKCRQHPAKMWLVNGNRMRPLLDSPAGLPAHSTPYQSLPEVYAQNASLEIAWSRVVFEEGTIAGKVVMPFLTKGYEGFDINRPEDWLVAEELVRTGQAKLPEVPQDPYPIKEPRR